MTECEGLDPSTVEAVAWVGRRLRWERWLDGLRINADAAPSTVEVAEIALADNGCADRPPGAPAGTQALAAFSR